MIDYDVDKVMLDLKQTGNMNLVEKVALVNQNEAKARMAELQNMLAEKSVNQKKLNIKIGFLES